MVFHSLISLCFSKLSNYYYYYHYDVQQQQPWMSVEQLSHLSDTVSVLMMDRFKFIF